MSYPDFAEMFYRPSFTDGSKSTGLRIHAASRMKRFGVGFLFFFVRPCSLLVEVDFTMVRPI